MNSQPLEFLKKQIAEFEKTIVTLQDNVKKLKKMLVDKEKKFGPDPDKWPEN
jgi:prefoldin subunit 5